MKGCQASGRHEGQKASRGVLLPYWAAGTGKETGAWWSMVMDKQHLSQFQNIEVVREWGHQQGGLGKRNTPILSDKIISKVSTINAHSIGRFG